MTKKRVNILRRLLAVAIVMGAGAYLVFSPHSTINAAPCAKDDQITTAPVDTSGKNCFDQGYDEIVKKYDSSLTVDKYNKAIKDCEATDGNLTADWHNATNQGNCANAIRSCYENVVDTRLCTNDGAMAYVASCSNDGNAGYDGDCGFDTAIDQVNIGHGGVDFNDNAAMEQKRRDEYTKDQEALCKRDNDGSPSAIEKCRQASEKAYTECYDSVGGQHKMIPQGNSIALNDCIRTKATDEEQCARYSDGKGIWTDNQCHQYSDFSNSKENCVAHGGRLVLTDAKDPNNANDDVWTCVDPSTVKCKDDSIPDKDNKCPDGSDATYSGDNTGPLGPPADTPKVEHQCGQARTNLISCDAGSASCAGDNGGTTGVKVINCVLKFGIQALTMIIGVAAVGGIAWEAVQYARAQDDQSIVSNAKNRIRDIIIGLIVYAFLVVAVNWLVPGGVIG